MSLNLARDRPTPETINEYYKMVKSAHLFRSLAYGKRLMRCNESSFVSNAAYYIVLVCITLQFVITNSKQHFSTGLLTTVIAKTLAGSLYNLKVFYSFRSNSLCL